MSKSRVVTFHYTLTDSKGQTLDSSAGQDPLAYLEDAGQIIPGLENELKSMKAGDKKKIDIAAKDGYGEMNSELVLKVPRKQFPSGQAIKVGDHFRTGSNSPVFRVLEVTDEHVSLDGNHPLAGQDLSFDVEIVEIRDATEEEIAHGHAHGPDGHHHH